MIIKAYTLDELCNENKQIIIDTQEGVRISIEVTHEGTRLYYAFGNEVIKREFDTLILPVEMPK